jgi:hypothetical protein
MTAHTLPATSGSMKKSSRKRDGSMWRAQPCSFRAQETLPQELSHPNADYLKLFHAIFFQTTDLTDCIPDTSVKNKYNINTHCIMLFPQTPVSYVYNHLIFCKQMESVMWNSNSRGNIHSTANLQPLRWNTLLNSCRHKQFDNKNVTYNEAWLCLCSLTCAPKTHVYTGKMTGKRLRIKCNLGVSAVKLQDITVLWKA